MILTAFDLEIAKEIPADEVDWKRHRPLGISCAGLSYRQDGGEHGQFFYGEACMSREHAQSLVYALRAFVDQGHVLVTWNGLAFDFAVLAEESGLVEECTRLALDHVDLMFMVVAHRGHYLALDTAADGMGLVGKLKEVKLRDGSIVEEMNGAQAPALWQAGEYDAVLEYLGEDLRVTLDIAAMVQACGFVRWWSRSGRKQIVNTSLLTVRECLEIPLPNNSWMTNPPSRMEMMGWMDARVLQEAFA